MTSWLLLLGFVLVASTTGARALQAADWPSRAPRIAILAYTTVLTVMDNLRRKGFLTRERVGRAHAYRPAKAQADYTADLMDELLADSGDRSATLLRFVDRMTPSEVSRLREALDD